MLATKNTLDYNNLYEALFTMLRSCGVPPYMALYPKGCVCARFGHK